MRSNYNVKTNVSGRRAARAGQERRPMLDGLEDRTFFAATPTTMSVPHFPAQAVAVEVVPVVMGHVGFGRSQVALEVIVIRQGMFGFSPHAPGFQPPAFGEHGQPPVASDNGGAAQDTGSSHVVATPRPATVTPAMQTVTTDSWNTDASGSNFPVIAADVKLEVAASTVASASTIEAAPSSDSLKLDSTTSPGLTMAMASPVAPVEGTPTLAGGVMSGIVAAFPPSLASFMQSSARPLEQAMVTLTGMMAPVSVANVFSTASPSEFLKAAAPGLAAALSSIGNLAVHADVPGGDGSAAWRNAAVVGVGLAAAGYGYSALQRRKAHAAEAAAAAEELARKEWDLQSFEDR